MVATTISTALLLKNVHYFFVIVCRMGYYTVDLVANKTFGSFLSIY